MKTGAELLRDIEDCELADGALAFWWLGQLSYIVRVGETVLYFDPYLAPRESRLVPPLLDARQITRADYVFGSHDHGDHIDPVALTGIAAGAPDARFICSHASARHLAEVGVPTQRVLPLDAEDTYCEGDVAITVIAAAHEDLEHDPELGYPHLGYVVEVGRVSIYFSGDTLCYDGLAARLSAWAFDVAFVPINGRDGERLARGCIGNMTCQEAVDLVGILRPRLAVPGHYDMFANNLGDVALFADYMDVKYGQVPYWIGEHGERVVIPAR